MNPLFVVLEFGPHFKLLSVHSVAFSGRNTYRERVSYRAFIKSMCDLPDDAEKLFTQTSLQHPVLESLTGKSDVPHRTHETLWDFYAAVGWDKKKKKFT